MIKFFRKIRQQLLKDSRVGKYLLYAIGEIVLVVIGILIALQINDFREQQRNSRTAEHYKNSLLIDLEHDLSSIDTRIDNARIRILGAERLLEFFEGKSEYDVFMMKEDLIRSGWLNFFIPNLNTYNDLMNSGNIKLMNDDSLKLLLGDYVNHCARIAVYEEQDKSNVWNVYGLKYRKWIDGRMSAAYLSQDSLKVNQFAVDWTGLSSDRDLQHALTLTLETEYGQIERYERVKEKIIKFIAFLRKSGVVRR